MKNIRSRIIVHIITVSILSNYIYGISGIGFVDDCMNIVILVWGVGGVIFHPLMIRKYRLVIFSYLIFVLLAVIFLYESYLPFVYELYKITLFLIFVPLFVTSSRVTVVRTDERIINILGILMAINLSLICLQYLVSPYIVTYLGLPVEQITLSTKSGRWVGLFEGVNIMGNTALLLFMLNKFTRPKHYKILQFIFFLSVFISTSKHSIAILMVLILFYGFKPYKVRAFVVKNVTRTILIIPFVLLVASVAFFLNETSVKSKISQYNYFFSNLTSKSELDARFLEKRALYSGIGLSIVQDYPFGVGLGVWGDASSKFNNNNYPFIYVEMSDSSMMHMLVEQGIFLILYFVVFLSGVSLARENGNRGEFIILFIVLLLIDLVTMGLSSGCWPLLFAYIYARLLWGPLQIDKRYRVINNSLYCS